MNSTSAKTNEKTYLVSFGNSDRYILRDTASGEASRLTKIERELNGYLQKKFADESFSYYTSPRVDEIQDPKDPRFAGYPDLDAKALETIKKVLSKEVEDMEAESRLNSNAPYANVNPGAADLPHII